MSRNLFFKFFIASNTVVFDMQDRYTHVKRGNFAELNDSHLKFFEELVGKDRIITDAAECESYNIDWIKNVRGNTT